MPTYEYRCRDCGNDLEVYQSFKDDPLTVCPVCGGSLRKLFGNVGISFKGTGFYKNDHGSRSSATTGDSNGSSTKSDSGSDSKSDSKSETKTESKPKTETKSDTKSSSPSSTASTTA
jgi:putative FmdB family regulatory protein